MFGSMVGGSSFARPMANVTFGRVEHCVTDLINHHVCVTHTMELVVIGIGVGDLAGEWRWWGGGKGRGMLEVQSCEVLR